MSSAQGLVQVFIGGRFFPPPRVHGVFDRIYWMYFWSCKWIHFRFFQRLTILTWDHRERKARGGKYVLPLRVSATLPLLGVPPAPSGSDWLGFHTVHDCRNHNSCCFHAFHQDVLYLLTPGHAISEVVDKVLTVALDEAVLHDLVDHLLGALYDLLHGQRQVGPVQLVVDLPGAAMQHIIQVTVLDHCPVAEDGSDAAHLEFLTWGSQVDHTVIFHIDGPVLVADAENLNQVSRLWF